MGGTYILHPLKGIPIGSRSGKGSIEQIIHSIPRQIEGLGRDDC